MQTANMDSCSLSLDYEVSSDSCTYLVFAVKTLLKQFPFRPIPGKLPPPVWCEWLPRKSLGPLGMLKNVWYLARFDVKFCHRRRISGTILMAIEVAPREALRNGTVLCKEVEDFVGNVSDKAPRSKCLKNTGDLVFYLWLQKCTPLTVLGMTAKMRDEGSFWLQ